MVDFEEPGEMLIMRSCFLGFPANRFSATSCNSSQRYCMCQFQESGSVFISSQNSFTKSAKDSLHISRMREFLEICILIYQTSKILDKSIDIFYLEQSTVNIVECQVHHLIQFLVIAGKILCRKLSLHYVQRRFHSFQFSFACP